MNDFFKNKWTIAGLVMVVFGWGPFCIALGLRLSGARPDLDLTGWGLLLFATFWPVLVCFALAIAQTLGKRRHESKNRTES